LGRERVELLYEIVIELHQDFTSSHHHMISHM
jgi:hypothetical protein